MADFPDEMIQRARDRSGRLVLPEGEDDRVQSAARRLVQEEIADEVLLLGDVQPNDEGVRALNPKKHPDRDEMAHRLANTDDDMSLGEAEDQIEQPLFFGAGLVATGTASGMVAGAVNPTANVLRAALKLLGTREGSSVVSSSFVMEVQDPAYGLDGRLLFTDPAVMPDPEPEQLSEMAADASRLLEDLLGDENDPRVAFLSFSTRGSADHPMVDHMREAAETFAQENPDIPSDGELQADAAIVPGVADRKAPDSELGGQANVLVFPDLDAANIGYKLVQRLGDAGAYGPFLQGLDGAVNDLSRGCSVEDIVTVGAVTVLQGTG